LMSHDNNNIVRRQTMTSEGKDMANIICQAQSIIPTGICSRWQAVFVEASRNIFSAAPQIIAK
jgi:hypothetical protein